MTQIRKAGPMDLPLLSAGLRALATSIDDPYPISEDDLARALFAPVPIAHALLAGNGAPQGLALFSPVVSTSIGGAGAYVSDLWVDESVRGTGLGRRLLAEVLRTSRDLWKGCYIRLSVYDDNPGALDFYHRLGFAHHSSEKAMILRPGESRQLLEATA